jgi:hypothetical protein
LLDLEHPVLHESMVPFLLKDGVVETVVGFVAMAATR